METQQRINRAVRLGRVPLLSARIIRAIDDAGLLGKGTHVVGTNALYAYEAAAAVMIDADIMTTADIDFLLDARRSLRVVADGELHDRTLLDLLKKVDRSFARSKNTYRAVNDDGYFVDLIEPQRNPPWLSERESLGDAAEDLAPMEGLVWLENASIFEAVAIDETGSPLRIVTVDPRVFAVHKFWLSRHLSRAPEKRRRDAMQAECAGEMVVRFLAPAFASDELKMLPRPVLEDARHLFEPRAPSFPK